MYERISFNFLHYKLLSFRNSMHLNEIHLLTSRAVANTENTSTLKIKSHNINSLGVHHNFEPFKHILTSLSKLSGKMLCMLAVCIAFTATTINLYHTLTSQNIDQERACRHSENSLLVQHFDNQQIRSNLNFFFVITSILTLIKTNKHPNH